MAVTFVYYRHFISRPWWYDDFGILNHPRLTLAGAAHYWNPHYGWYYRPVFNVYIDFVMTVFHHQPRPVHAVGIAITGIVVWLLAIMAYRLGGPVASVLAVWFFLTVPLKEEAIWWPSSANTLLAALFTLSAIVLWHAWTLRRRRGLYWLALVAALFALCSKEEAIALPLCLIVADWRWRPDVAMRRRFLDFLPLLAAAFIFALCAGIGYHEAALQAPTARLFAFAPAQRGLILMNFANREFIVHYITLPPASMALIWFSTAVILAMALQWKDKTIQVLMSMAVISTMPNPLGTGIHSASQRFHFIPGMMIALAYSVAFCRLASSRSVPVRQTAIALAVNFLIVHLPMPYVDPGDACMVLYVMAILGMLAWRIGWLDGRLLALGIVAMAVNQVFAFMSDNGREIWWIGMAALGGALVSRRTGWLAGLVSAVVLVNQAFVAVPLFWIAAPLDFRLRARNCLPAVSDGTSDQRPTA